jgi:hypothetical protein
MKKKYQGLNALFLSVFFLFAEPPAVYAQEGAPMAGGNPTNIEVRNLTPEQNRINMEIRTSSLSELASWCRSLGLSEAGTRDDLAGRLRNFFQFSDQPSQSGEDKRKIITIESARSTEYFTVQEIDEDYARLTGDVRISLKDGDAIHQIRARNILFNRTRNILTAEGGVEYIKTEGDKIETFRGDSITVDINNWSSIFLGGISERSLQSDDTTYLFAGTVISRDDEDVTVLKQATISNANNEDSMWSINATQVWLLPGSDFAIFNAVLKVGEIPVMYIPFFYFPADEIVFHPVIGSRTREGNYFQSTTYILGRPKASSSTQSSLTRILGNSNDMEKRREGLFLRSTGKPMVDPSETTLRLMADYYANLGGFLGVDFGLPAKGIFGANNMSLGLGFTRTIYPDGALYTPFYPEYDGSTDWNNSKLFSTEVPFRYRFTAASSISGKYGNFSWDIPFYSDPYVDNDFLNRTEDMDFINMIQQGAQAMEEDTSTQNLLGNYSWRLSGNLSPQLTKMSPYITNISINGISSNISFKTIDSRYLQGIPQSDIKYYSPSAYFFAPDTATIYTLSGHISGTPLSFPSRSQSSSNLPLTEPENPLRDIGVPRSPFEIKEPETPRQQDPFDKLVPPPLTQRFDLPRSGNLNFSMNYSFNPTGSSLLKFDSDKWKEFGDIDWSDVSYVTSRFEGTASTNYTVSHSSGLFSSTFSFLGSGAWSQYSYLNEESSDFPTLERINEAKKQEYIKSFFSTSYNINTTIKPLYFNNIFGASTITHSLTGLVVKSRFIGEGDNPEWELDYSEWTKERIDSHLISANLNAMLMDKTQSFSFSADLPPRDPSYTFRTAFNVWISTTSADWRFREVEESMTIEGETINERRWKYDPFNLTQQLNFGTFGNFSLRLSMDTENWNHDPDWDQQFISLTSSLNLTKWGLSVSYTASRMRGYEFQPGLVAGSGTWVQRTGDERLQSSNFSINYSKSFIFKDLWNKRLNLSINTTCNLRFDLQRYTNSNLSFSLGYTLGISKFLDFTMSINSENSVIYRYFKDWPMFSDAPINLPDGPQNNFFLDLINSFRFDNEDLRKLSGFKMKTFNLSATHYMGDWNATLSWSMAPYRPTGSPPRFEMNNDVSFFLQWIPISEIKSDISYNKSDDKWTVKN